MKTFYVKADIDGIIYDAYSYETHETIEVSHEEIPNTILAKCWKLGENGRIEFIKERDPYAIDNIVQERIDEYTMMLIEGGLL